MKFKILVLAIVEGVTLIRIKQLSSIKALRGDRLGISLHFWIFSNVFFLGHNWKK